MGISILQAVLFVVSTAYQITQQKKMKKKMEAEADKRRGFRTTVRGRAETLPVIYGKQMVGGIEVKHKVSKDYTYAASGANATIFDENLGTTDVTGTKSEFLTVQTALCQDGIEGVQYVHVDGKSYNLEEAKFKHRIVINNNGGSAEPLATANGIPSTNIFTGTAFATSVYRLNREEPNYNGIPTAEYFVKGRKVRAILNNAGTYSLSGTYTYSNNPALCLLDYMLNADFGKGLSTSDIDLESFYNAATICDTTVLTNAEAFGRINNFKPVLDFDTQSDFPDVGEESNLYQAADTGNLFKWTNSTGLYSSYSASSTSRNVTLYECNIAIDTSNKIRDNIETILQTMGLAELVWSSEGQYKLLLEYPADETALNALIDPTHHFDEDTIIRDDVDISWTPLSERFNHVTVRYLNEHEDFKEDSKSWPPKGGSVYSTYENEDNGQLLSSDLFFEGCSDPYHALAKAEQMVRQSRDMYTISLTVSKQGLTLEPGDFFSVTLDSQGLDGEIFRVESIEVSEDLTAKLTGYKFSSEFLAWNVADNEAYTTIAGVDSRIPGPASITATDTGFVNPDGIFSSAVKLEWPASDDASVRNYEIQYKVSTDDTYNSYRTNQLTHTITGLKTGEEYDFQVRAISNTGQYSAFATVIHTIGGDTTVPGLPTLLTATGNFKYISLEWNNPADIDLAFVEIYENTANSTTGGTRIATTLGNTYTRSGLGLDVTKYYYVQAVDNAGNVSGFSNVASATTTYLDDPDFANGVYQIFKDQGLYAIQDSAGLPASGSFTGEKIFNTNDGKLYQWSGSAWEQVVGGAEDFSDLAGSIADAQIPDGLIDTLKLSDDAVTNAKIAVNAIQGDVIAAGAITNTKIGTDAVTTAKLANEAVTAAVIAAGAITNTKIGANAVTTAKLANDAVTADIIAAGAITNTKIGANAVDTANIAIGAITATELGVDAVTSIKIQNSAITSAKIGSDAVTTSKIANNAITSDLINANAITETKIASDAITTPKIAAGAITASEIAAGSITASEIAANTISAGNIAAGAITASEIASGAITTGKLAAGAVTANEIAADAITTDKIDAGAVTSAKIIAGAITTEKIEAGAITSTELAANSVTATQIAANSVTAAEIAAGTITSAEILANTITAGNIEAGAITSTELATNSVTATQIAANTITASKIAAGTITSAEILANTITAGNIEAGTITSDELSANSVTATQIAANTITAGNIAAGAITSSEIAADTIAASNIAAGAITSDEIAANAITSAKIDAGAIIADKIAAGTITGDKIGANEITGNEISGQTITGNNIVANTITGGLLATSGIITNTAQISNAVIESANIKNAAVDTLKIAGRAVTIPTTSVNNNLLQFTTAYQDYTVATLTFTSTGESVLITWSFVLEETTGEIGVRMPFKLYRNNTLIYRLEAGYSGLTYSPYIVSTNFFTGSYMDTGNSAGSVTYRVDMQRAQLSTTATYATDRVITALEVKR
jgi:hypothetical protein